MVFPDLSLLKQLRYQPTDLPKLRFWDNFSGQALDTDIWNQTTFSGSPIYSMVDEIDEGFEIDSNGSATNNGGFIDSLGIDQFNHIGVECICVMKLSHATDIRVLGGLMANNDIDGPQCLMGSNTQSGNNFLIKIRNGGNLNVASSQPLDTEWHTHSFVLTASNVVYKIDEILRVSTTVSARPDAPMGPTFEVLQTKTSPRQGRIRYYEVYNT